MAVIRLEYQGRTLGILYVNFDQPQHYRREQKKILNAIADQTAIAIKLGLVMKEVSVLATQHERNRLREDLHNAMAKIHIKLMLQIESLRDKLSSTESSPIAVELDQLWHQTEHIYRHLARILKDMRDPILVEKGLLAAMEAYVKDISKVKIDLALPDRIKTTAEIELAFYRIFQEAITNVIKHAARGQSEFTQVLVRLEEEDARIALSIVDNGKGFSVKKVRENSPGFGLETMSNWSNSINGNLEIESTAENGTRIMIEKNGGY
jgi:signal transduction histidine kinase